MRLFRCCALTFPLLFATACGSFAVQGDGTPEPADPYQQVRAAVADRPPVPGEREMLASVELVTFPFRRDELLQRDTIRTPIRVASWLARLQSQTAESTRPFRLTTREVMICEGAAVERGEYALGGVEQQAPGIGSRAVRATPQYLALWRPVGDEWRLDRLWLSPDPSVRVANLATGCRADPTTFSGLTLGVAFGGETGPDLDAAGTQLKETGYSDLSPQGAVLPAIRVWTRVGILPRVFLVLEYDKALGGGIRATDTTGVYPRAVDFNVHRHTVALLAQTRVGPVWLAAGPAATVTVADFALEIQSPSPYTREASESSRTVGAMLRSSFRMPLGAHFLAVGSLGYAYFPDLEVMEGLQTTVGLSGLNGGIGIEWTP